MASRLLTARVLLREAAPLDEGAIFAALARFPGVGTPRETRRGEGSLAFVLDGHRLAVSTVNEPLPEETLNREAAAAWYWPEAAEVLRGHRAQILVGVVLESTQQVEAALSLTALAAAVATFVGAPGIEWPAAGLVHPTEAFATYTRQMDRSRLPLELWIDFHVYPEPDGSFSLATRGLDAFGVLEIEVSQSRRDPETVLGRVYDVAHYLLEKGAVLRDGETIGVGHEEQIPITLGPSREDLSRRAIHLTFS